MSFDMDPAGNTVLPSPSTPHTEVLALPPQPCARAQLNGQQDFDEDGVDQIRFDLTIEGVPSTGGNGMTGWTATINFPDTQLRYVSHASDYMIAANLESSLFDPGTTIEPGKVTISVVDIGSGLPESGNGVLARVTFRVDTTSTPGLHPMTMSANHYFTTEGMEGVPLVTKNAQIAIGQSCPADADGDGVSDPFDNCPNNANANQTNLDGDLFGDICDADDDGEGVNDSAESACGSDPADVAPPLSRPERIDGAFVGVDDDGDTTVDEPLPVNGSSFDCDGDGYAGSAENHVYAPSTVADQDPCGTNTSPPTIPASPIGWPADLQGGGIPNSDHRVTLLDVTSFIGPVRYYNTDVGDHPGDLRWDLRPGPGVFGFDINLNDLTSLSLLAPAMLGGVRAFNGPICPWP
jgi:hypothetical protein